MYERNYKLLNRKFREFLLPTLFTSMAGNISIFIDSLLVSILIGNITLSVMQIIQPVSTLINLLYWMIGLGGSLVCAISKAEFDEERSNGLFTASILSMIAVGIIIMVISLLFTNSILQVLCTSADLKPLVSQFFIYYVIGIPFLCYMMSMSYFIKSDGFLKLPFVSILISNVFNLIFDIVFIYYFNWGLQGAALATTTSFILGSLCMSTYFLKKTRTLKFIKIKFYTIRDYLIVICKSGFSTASTQLYLTIKLYVVNFVLGGLVGAIGLVAFNLCNNTLFIISIFIIGISQSMSPIISLYYKEKDYCGVDYVIKKSFKMMVVVDIAFFALLTIYPQIMIFIFNVQNPEYTPYILNALRIFSLSYLLTGTNFLYIYYTQAIQEDKLANILQLLEGLIFPIAVLLILTFMFGELGLWSSFFVTELLVFLFIISYSRFINKKTNGKYQGFFIKKEIDDNNFINYSINANIEDVVGLSSKINEYLADYAESTRVSVAVEEILVNIINLNESLDSIDVYLKKTDEEIILSIKDDGIEYNPIVENDNLEFDNISFLNRISDKVDYTRVLGLNSTVITIKNNEIF